MNTTWTPVRHVLTATAHSDHDDIQPMGSLRCRPGVSIEVEYHPDFEEDAVAALEAAYRDVRAQIVVPK